MLSNQSATHDAYCIGNGMRPLLSYGPKDSKTGRKTYLFVEALRRYSEESRGLTAHDLREAYKRARPMYSGRLEHTFIVLKDTEGLMDGPSGANREPVGQKRPATPGTDSVFKKAC